MSRLRLSTRPATKVVSVCCTRAGCRNRNTIRCPSTITRRWVVGSQQSLVGAETCFSSPTVFKQLEIFSEQPECQRGVLLKRIEHQLSWRQDKEAEERFFVNNDHDSQWTRASHKQCCCYPIQTRDRCLALSMHLLRYLNREKRQPFDDEINFDIFGTGTSFIFSCSNVINVIQRASEREPQN